MKKIEWIFILIFHLQPSRLQATKPDWRWQLQASGRFAHNKEYVEEVGKQCSLKVLYYEEMRGFRKEGANDVNGHIFIMEKQSSPSEEL
jgi:predicted TPR repeat methyltransferase